MATNPIQTPLIGGYFSKQLGHKVFTVCSDSLAKEMWRGYVLIAYPIERGKLPESDDLIIIECQIVGRKRYSYQVGIFKSVENGRLTLHYNDPRIKADYADWSIPLWQVKCIWEVDMTCRDYKYEKFNPWQSKNPYYA